MSILAARKTTTTTYKHRFLSNETEFKQWIIDIWENDKSWWIKVKNITKKCMPVVIATPSSKSIFFNWIWIQGTSYVSGRKRGGCFSIWFLFRVSKLIECQVEWPAQSSLANIVLRYLYKQKLIYFMSRFTHPGSPPASMLLAKVTSLDQTSYCHLRNPKTPHNTRPEWIPTRMFSCTSVASTTDLCAIQRLSYSAESSLHIFTWDTILHQNSCFYY